MRTYQWEVIALVSIPRIDGFPQTAFKNVKGAINNALIGFLLYPVGKLRTYSGPFLAAVLTYTVLLFLSK